MVVGADVPGLPGCGEGFGAGEGGGAGGFCANTGGAKVRRSVARTSGAKMSLRWITDLYQEGTFKEKSRPRSGPGQAREWNDRQAKIARSIDGAGLAGYMD